MVLADLTCDSRWWAATCHWVLGLAISGQSMCCYRAGWPPFPAWSQQFLALAHRTLMESCTDAQMWVAHLGLLGCAPCGCCSGHNPGKPLRRSPCTCAEPLWVLGDPLHRGGRSPHSRSVEFVNWTMCRVLLQLSHLRGFGPWWSPV